ncbi:hypothetical protein TNCV_4379931 [Trichonephila clavipes]|nr:hypothetical protein TNCV_4379931 [Trichonephila clavipes]
MVTDVYWEAIPTNGLRSSNREKRLSVTTKDRSVYLCQPLWVVIVEEGEYPGGSQKPLHLSSLSANLAKGFEARRLFRVPPCSKGATHLQTSMSSPEFKPSPDETAFSITNHYTG